MATMEIPSGNLTEWLDELKPYQRNAMSVFLESNSEEEAAKIWVSTTGSKNIIPFGGAPDSKPFWERFRAEFRKFVCDEKAYSEEKLALAQEASVTRSLLISAVSAAIGATIGYAATLLAPAVAVLLCVVGKMGIRAYCEAG